MTTIDRELAQWGEAPTTATEATIASWLDALLEQVRRSPDGKAEAWRDAPPDMIQHLPEMVKVARLLFECAAAGSESYDLAETDGPPDPFPGEFRLGRLLGEGHYGQVWLAEDLLLQRRVVLKRIRLRTDTEDGSKAIVALQNEGKLLSQVRHPNIVQVYAWRQSADPYLIMQYVNGGSLADRLKREHTIPWDAAARYIADVGEGLMAVHRTGIIHRDIKPSNILWDSATDEALLGDFGIAAYLGAEDVSGTPLYMAPEAFQGRPGFASDVYSLAATLFHLVTGSPPFPARDHSHLLQQIRRGLPDPDARCDSLPESLESIIRAGLRPERDRRPDLAQLVEEIRRSLNMLLADTLIPPHAGPLQESPVGLHLVVCRLESDGTYRPVTATRAKASTSRSMRIVPRPPDQLMLRTGDRVGIQVTADRDGYIAVFNVGPDGSLNLLHPADPSALTAETSASLAGIRAGQTLNVLDVEMIPPGGNERVFGIWTRRFVPLRLDQYFALAEKTGTRSCTAYAATRSMLKIRRQVRSLAQDEWRAVVVELEHRQH